MESGKFINTEIVNTLDNLAGSLKDRLSNPFYNFSDKKGITVTYFNIDISNMPLDNVTGLDYSSIGNMTNIKYNKVINFVIYGIERMPITINNTDEGTEADEISGEAMILPNTIHPYAGDYFFINHMEEGCLFRVTDAQSDTFNNGSNVWQISYILEHYSNEQLEKYNVGTTSYFLLDNAGTQYSSVIQDSIYETISRLDEVLSDMRKYYRAVFYNDRVDSLIFENKGNRFYDGFLTEFIIKNKLLEERKDYLYIQHQIAKSKTFDIDYNRSFFSIIESKNRKKLSNCRTVAYAELIESKINIFSNRPEPYLELFYSKDIQKIIDTFAPNMIFEIFDPELIAGIINNQKFGNDVLADILIKYFNDEDLSDEDIDKIDMINYKNSVVLFYYIPVAMYIIEYTIKKLMSKKANI